MEKRNLGRIAEEVHLAVASTTLLPLTSDTALDSMLNGSFWHLDGSRQITWGLADNYAYYWADPAYTAAVISVVFDTIELYINVDFVFTGIVSDFTASTADITFNLGDSSLFGPTTLGVAVFPNYSLAEQIIAPYGLSNLSYQYAEGDIWFNNDFSYRAAQYHDPGSQIYFAVLHEVGHALGLKHPHDDGMTGSPTFAQAGLSQYDSEHWTIMSYNGPGGIASGHAASPMYFDIIALQELYGANPNTNAGNSTFTLESRPFGITLYDVSGTDVISAAATSSAVTINLNSGAISRYTFSSSSGYLGIADGTEIENAIGGFGSDQITGNAAANWLQGNAGADTIFSGLGNDAAEGGFGRDLLFGGQGADSLYGGDDADQLFGALGDDLLLGDSGDDQVYGAMGRDTVGGGLGNDLVSGLRDDDVLYGEDGADTIWSGAGNDIAYGGAGNDVIYGSLGDDRFHGEGGADTFIFEPGWGVDQVIDFSYASGDRIRIVGQSYSIRDTAEGMALNLSSGGSLVLHGIEPNAFSAAFLV